MKKRVITATIMSLILIPILFFGSYFMIPLIMFMSFMGVFELSRMYVAKNTLPKRYKIIFPIIASLLSGLISTYFLLYNGRIEYLGLGITILLVVFVLLLIIPIFDNQMKIKDSISFIGFIIYGGLLFTLMARIRFIDNIGGVHFGFNIGPLYINLIGLALIGYAFLTSAMTDVGAQLGGMALGKHKLCPKISPKKTIEGSIIGSITGTIIGLTIILLCEYFGSFIILPIENEVLRIIVMAIITFSLTIFAQLGDLVASLIKREHNIKDYGNLLPGHGGIMDRFDSTIMVCTVFFVIFSIISFILGDIIW